MWNFWAIPAFFITTRGGTDFCTTNSSKGDVCGTKKSNDVVLDNRNLLIIPQVKRLLKTLSEGLGCSTMMRGDRKNESSMADVQVQEVRKL